MRMELLNTANKQGLAVGVLMLFVLGTCLGYYLKASDANRLSLAMAELEHESLSLKARIAQLEADLIEKDQLVADRMREMEDFFNNELARQNQPVKPTAHPLPQIRTAYLTFDDGPLAATSRILDILKEHEVPATFFVNGRDSAYALKMYRRMVEEGHAIGNHSYSHDYYDIYSSVSAFVADINKLQELIFNAVGVKPEVLRFPGGSNNQINASPALMSVLTREVRTLGFQYFDWNVSAGSSTSTATKETVLDNVLSGVVGQRVINVLLHDAHIVAEALPEIIEELRTRGYTFAVLTKDSYPIQFR